MEREMTYESAYNELLQIAREIEDESVSVDVLAEKVKRASELIEFCQKKLKTAEGDLNNIIDRMNEN
jgi:exodeoxyribonuclease VII small subunit